MAINNRNVTETKKPANMSDDQWAIALRSLSAAQLATFTTTRSVFCCDDAVAACQDHDSDVTQYKAARAAVISQFLSGGLGSITTAQLAAFVLCDARLRNKGITL